MSATSTRRPTARTMRKMTGLDDATPIADVVAAWTAMGSPARLADVATTPADPEPAPADEPTPAPAPAKDRPAPANCGCGCGVPTVTAKATFLAGHDARHAGTVGRGLAATPDDADLLAAYERMTPALQAKTDKIRETAESKNRIKAAREEAKRAYEAALAAI